MWDVGASIPVIDHPYRLQYNCLRGVDLDAFQLIPHGGYVENPYTHRRLSDGKVSGLFLSTEIVRIIILPTNL